MSLFGFVRKLAARTPEEELYLKALRATKNFESDKRPLVYAFMSADTPHAQALVFAESALAWVQSKQREYSKLVEGATTFSASLADFKFLCEKAKWSFSEANEYGIGYAKDKMVAVFDPFRGEILMGKALPKLDIIRCSNILDAKGD
jgi:hypothetical protein